MVAQVQSIGDALCLTFANALSTFFIFIPHLLGAIIVLIIGFVVGRLVGGLATRGLRAVTFDQIAERAEVGDVLRNAGGRGRLVPHRYLRPSQRGFAAVG